MATFTYSALDLAGPTFRLIRLLPGLSFDMIECEMIEARLEGLGDTIPYEALSYTWGQDGKNKCIEVNGCSFPVTANLHLALLHLRHRSSDRLLWVDAICINQSDPTERGHQVKQMRYIYQEAEQVLIWLGSATDDTDIAMSTMMDLQQISLRGNSNWRQLADILLDTDLTHPRISLKIRRRFGAQELISRPWFNRVWILQEVANSRAALILCGHQSVLARIFALAMPLLLENTIDSHCQAVLDIMPGISRRESWWSRERSLRTLLLKFNMSIATDPRDMVFALLGMSSDIPDDSLVQVNYHKTLGEVIRDTVIFLLPHEARKYLSDSLKTRFLSWSLQGFFGKLDSLNANVIQEAIEVGNTIAIKALISQGTMSAKIERTESKTLLSWAFEQRHHFLVKLLLDASDINLGTMSDYKRLLRLAAMEGFTHQSQVKTGVTEDAVRQLLEQGYIDTESTDAEGQTFFSYAVETEDTAIISPMLQMPGIDVNPEDKYGRTPLLYLAEVGDRPRLMMALLRRKDVKINSQDYTGRTALSWAADSSRISKAKQWNYLLDGTAGYLIPRMPFDGSSEMYLRRKQTLSFLLHRDGIDVNLADIEGLTPLLWAITSGNSEYVQMLLGHESIDVNQRDNIRRSPLLCALEIGAACGQGEKHTDFKEILRALLRAKDIDVNARDACEDTPFSWALLETNWRKFESLGFQELIGILLSRHDINFRSVNGDGSTPLSLIDDAEAEGFSLRVRHYCEAATEGIQLREMILRGGCVLPRKPRA